MKTKVRPDKLAVVLCFSLLMIISGCEVADDLLGNEVISEIEGEWSVDETSEVFGKKSTLSVYTVTISPDPDNLNGIIIDNFYNVGISVRANVSGSSITIPNQEAEDGYTVYGSGTISGNRNEIDMSYVVNDGSAQDDNCTADYTKL
jgi:hypothetical protein